MKSTGNSIIPEGIKERIRKSHCRRIHEEIKPLYCDDLESKIRYKSTVMSLKVCAMCKNSHTLSLSHVNCTILDKKVIYNYTCDKFKHNSQMNPNWEAKLKEQIISNNNKQDWK